MYLTFTSIIPFPPLQSNANRRESAAVRASSGDGSPWAGDDPAAAASGAPGRIQGHLGALPWREEALEAGPPPEPLCESSLVSSNY